jgi:hypothetical protein
MSSSSVEQVDHRRLQDECASSVLDIIQKEIARLHCELEKPCGWERLGARERRGRKMLLINSSFYDT